VKEVSCRFFETLLRDLRERGIDASRLTEGTPYRPAHLGQKDERVEWAMLVRMMENGRAFWTPEQLIRLGERSTESPLVQFVGVVARIRFSVATFYQWVAAPDGIARQMIACIAPTYHAGGAGRLAIDLRMLPGYPVSREFFLITQGTYSAMPRMIGAKPARVTMTDLPDGVRLHV